MAAKKKPARSQASPRSQPSRPSHGRPQSQREAPQQAQQRPARPQDPKHRAVPVPAPAPAPAATDVNPLPAPKAPKPRAEQPSQQMAPKPPLKAPKPAAAPVPVTRAGTIALIGRPNVGKSTLLNALLGERIAITSRHAQTTRDRIAGIITEEGVQYVFLDTPGLHRARHKLGERMNDVANAAAAECDVAIFMTEPELRNTTEGPAVAGEVREDDRAILGAIPESTPIVLLLNKIDRIKHKQVLFPLLEAYGKERNVAAIVPISALKGDGRARILAEVAKLLPEGPALFDEEEISDKPVRFFVGEFVREQILQRTRQEIPHGVAVTVESFDEGAKLIRISVTIHVAKESHKGIIIGDGGRMLVAVGSAARKRAEELIGRKVHLETFVRCTAGWFDDAARLRDMGYAGDAPTKKGPGGKSGRRSGSGGANGSGKEVGTGPGRGTA